METENTISDTEPSPDNMDASEHRRLTIENPSNLPKSLTAGSVDRQRACPMYVRLFCRMNGHHPLSAYEHDPPIEDEVIIYTWRDATLRELSDLIKEVNVECRRRGARFSFQLIYYDYRGIVRMKDMGMVSNGRIGRDDAVTLEKVKFVQGDFIDVAIFTGNSGSLARRTNAEDRVNRPHEHEHGHGRDYHHYEHDRNSRRNDHRAGYHRSRDDRKSQKSYRPY